ncbi:MAG TPA: hypothetical protein VGJ15_01770, partial [Pirellulales bacterium]
MILSKHCNIAWLLATVASIVATFGPTSAAEPAKPQVVSALDLKRGDAVIMGLLRKPLGTDQIIVGNSVPPKNEQLNNTLYVTESGNMAWGAGVAIEIRGVPFEKDKHYRLEGYESAEFLAESVNQPGTASLHYHPLFIVTCVLDPNAPDSTSKIDITFAKDQAPLPLGVPRSARNETIEDTGNDGPLAKLTADKIASLEVTSSDAKRFYSEPEVAAFLRQLLREQNGSTWKFQVWSQKVVPMLVVTVEHINGKPGTWYIGPNGDNQALSVYQDGDGKWWFSIWDNLKIPSELPK